MPCSYLPLESYLNFSQRIHEKVIAQRVPISGSLEVTERCNVRCGHCYINQSVGDQSVREQELTTDEIKDILDQITDAGCLWLLLTGGEVFIRPDFIEIYKYAKQKGLLLTLFSNGTTITPKIADTLAEWPPFAMEISIYGSTEATYERVTGVSGAYQRAMRGIALLQERQVPLKLKTTVTKDNYHEVADMQALAQNLGTSFRFDAVLNMRLDGTHSPAQYRLQPKDVVALDSISVARKQVWQDTFKQPPKTPPQPDNLYYCGAGINTFHIDAYGHLSVCMMARANSYSLRDGTFDDGWQNALNIEQSRIRQKMSPCQTCNIGSACPQCPGLAFIETGDPEQRIDYLCEITHLRAETFRA